MHPVSLKVSELLTSLPKVLGGHWLKYFVALYPALTVYLGAGHPASDKSLAIGERVAAPRRTAQSPSSRSSTPIIDDPSTSLLHLM